MDYWNRCLNTIMEADFFKIYFGTRKVGKRGFVFFEPGITEPLKDDIKYRLIEDVNNFKSREIADYNPINNDQSSICRKAKSKTLLIEEFEESINPDNIEDIELLVLKKIDFFVYEFQKNGKQVFIVSKHRNISVSAHEKLFTISGMSLKKFDDDKILRVSTRIDFIIDVEDIFSINHSILETIFDLREEFHFYAANLLNSDSIEKEKIVNYDELTKRILSDGSYTKRMAKLYHDHERVGLFTKYMDNTIKVIRDRKLNIKVDHENKKLIYTEDMDISKMVSIFQDSYYRTLIGGREGEDTYN